MKVFTLSEARRKLGALLELVETGSEVRICRKDGQTFSIRSVEAVDTRRSLLDIPGVDLGVSAEEIVDTVREGRDRP